MDTRTPVQSAPATYIDIDNRIIDEYLPQIRAYGFAVYIAIQRYLNPDTNHCTASYATIARKLGIDRRTVSRYVKKLQALDLISPTLQFQEEGES